MALQEQSAPGKLPASQNASRAPVVFISAQNRWYTTHQKNVLCVSIDSFKIINTSSNEK